MRQLAIALMLAVLVAGCGKAAKKEPVALDQIPENVISVAKKEMPGVTLQRAMMTPKGDYEILGKDKKGKTHEIYVSPQGVVTGRE